MKKLIFSSLVGFSCILSGCGDTLDFRNAEISNGKVFSKGSNTPFSGNVTNIPMIKLPVGKLAKLLQIISAASKDDSFSKIAMANAVVAIAGNGESAILCDVAFNKGSPDGDATCKLAKSEIKLFKVPYKNGSVNGDLIVFDPNKKDTVVAETAYLNGEPNGLSSIKSSKTGNVVSRVTWANGSLNGLEENFDENTGKLVFKGNIKDGQYDGVSEKYSSDGSLLEKTEWKNGIPKKISNAGDSVNSPEKCVDQWIAAYRKEQGEEALIRNEQLDEWESWCKEGKLPRQG